MAKKLSHIWFPNKLLLKCKAHDVILNVMLSYNVDKILVVENFQKRNGEVQREHEMHFVLKISL